MARRELPSLTNVVWLRRHALADGFNHQTITALVKSGEWYAVRRGAYTSGELWRSLGPEDRHRLLCRAVLLVVHPSTVLTHVSSAIEQGAETWGFNLDQVHTTRTDGKGGRNEAGVIRHEGVLLESEVEIVNGVRVTPAARALAETCTIAGVEPALTVVNSLLHQGVVQPAEFDDQVLATRSWPRSLTTDLVRRLAEPRIESVAETRAFHLFWKEHIPRPEPQVEVYDETGRLVGRVDFVWLRYGVFAEMDGKLKYLTMRREGESLDDFLMREKRREELICAITGWVCIRITWDDLAHPRLLARRIRRLLESRAVRPA
jgi:nicotinamidase-related amidase